jgi:hypothetical protein
MPLSTVIVTGSWKTPAPGVTATGLVTVQPVTEAVGGGYILAGVPIGVRLTAGAINEVLVSNTEVTTLQYLVTERIDGAPVVQYVITPTGSTLDLSTAPRGTGPVIPMYLLASTRGAANGVAPLDSGSHIPSQYLPAGSGVLSVTAGDGTITVGGDASHPTVAVGTITKATVGLGNVDNTSDTAKPVSTATATALAGKDPAGAATAAVDAHDGAADPHPQYLTQAEGDGLYATTAGLVGKATRPILRRAYIANPSDTTLPNTGGLWAPVPGFELQLPAAVGDDVEHTFNGMRGPNADACLDIAVIVGSTLVRFLASGTGTPALEGDPAWYTQTTFIGHSGPRGFTVTGPDRDGSVVRFVLACKATGAGTVFASTNYPFSWRAINRGVVG